MSDVFVVEVADHSTMVDRDYDVEPGVYEACPICGRPQKFVVASEARPYRLWTQGNIHALTQWVMKKAKTSPVSFRCACVVTKPEQIALNLM